jgi:dihydrofolate synthase/folylpolyglutamate synthase
MGSTFHAVDYSKLTNVRCTLSGADFDFGEYKNIHINLLGLYQPENASSVISAIPLLRARGFNVPDEAIRRGLAAVVWEARFEKLSDDPIVIYDGSHNPQAIEAAVRSIKALFCNNKVNILTGVMKDKDYRANVKLLAPVTRRAFTVTPSNSRSLPSVEYAKVFCTEGMKADAYETLEAGAKAAYADSKANGVPLVILGSLYMYADIKKALGL